MYICNMYKFLSILYLIIAQVMVWVQGYGPNYIPWMKPKYMPYILAIPTTYIFLKSIDYGIKGFEHIWTIRINSFVIGTFIFFIMSYLIANQTLNMKNLLCLILCGAIVAIQIFWK